jgi:molybdopterin molybdotransferase
MTSPTSDLLPMATLTDIGDQLSGYDPKALPANTVLAFLEKMVPNANGSEHVAIFQALDRVLAQDVISPISVPPHDNSAMDGYAFNGQDLPRKQTLQVMGTAYAGTAWPGQLLQCQCAKIMTGAIMPGGSDTVIPQELVHIEGDAIQIAAGILQRGDNRRLCGEDLKAGQTALISGTRMGPAACGLLASLGLKQVSVRPRLKVAYFSTGNEILSLGQAPREGAVYDSNRYTVHGMLTRMGCEVIDMGVVHDDPALLETAFRQAALQADVVITSGGVSVGEADHTKDMMKKLGDVAFWRIAMRPGRPMAVGRIPQGGRSCVLFGLPGNPVAVMVTFLAFVRPTLERMMGMHRQPLPLLKARSQDVLRKKPGRTEYQRGIVSTSPDGELQVTTTGNQGSGVLSSMVQANGLIVLHHEQETTQKGDWVDVMMFEGHL